MTRIGPTGRGESGELGLGQSHKVAGCVVEMVVGRHGVVPYRQHAPPYVVRSCTTAYHLEFTVILEHLKIGKTDTFWLSQIWYGNQYGKYLAREFVQNQA